MHFKLPAFVPQKLFRYSVSSDFKNMLVNLFCFAANTMHIKKHVFFWSSNEIFSELVTFFKKK